MPCPFIPRNGSEQAISSITMNLKLASLSLTITKISINQFVFGQSANPQAQRWKDAEAP